jgi:hypothetical protein
MKIQKDLASVVYGGPDYLSRIERLVPASRRIPM